MSKQAYYEQVEKFRYICSSCGNQINPDERYMVIHRKEALDFHNECLWQFLIKTFVPYNY
jgi:hypothetical protein